MSKRILLCMLVVCALLLSACTAQPAAKPLPDCETMGTAIQNSQSFTEEMMTLSESKMLRALDLDDGSYTAVWMAMDASRTTAEAIVVVNAKDAASAKAVAEKLESYRADTLRQYQDYRPEEAPKLESAKVLTNGTQCVLVICADQSKAQAAVNSTWGK